MSAAAGKPTSSDVSGDVRLQSSGSNASSTSGKSVAAGRRRSSSGKNAPKKSPPTTQADVGAERSSGFLRSLRNIFVRKRRPVSAAAVKRARSSETLDQVGKSTAGHCSPRTVLRQDPTSPVQLLVDRRRMTSVPYSKVFSVSADDLLDSSQWVIVQTSSGACSSAENLDGTSSIEGGKASVSSMDDLSSDTEATASEFFNLKWSEHIVISDKPALTTQADEFQSTLIPDDLDVVRGRQLDVSVVKDRLAVKQKNKRQTAVFQQKIQLSAKHSVGATGSGLALPSVAEDIMEDNNDVTAAAVASRPSKSRTETSAGARLTVIGALTTTAAAAAACYDEHDGHLTEIQESSGKTRFPESGNARSSKPPVCLPVPTGPTDRHLAMMRPVINPDQLADVMRRTARTRSGSSTPPRDYDVTPRDLPTSPLSPRSTDKNRLTKELDKVVCQAATRSDIKSELEKRIATRHHSGDNKLNAAPTAAAAAPGGVGGGGGGGGGGVDGGKSNLLKVPKSRPTPRPETMAPIGGSRNSERAAMFVETEWLSGVQRRTQHWDK